MTNRASEAQNLPREFITLHNTTYDFEKIMKVMLADNIDAIVKEYEKDTIIFPENVRNKIYVVRFSDIQGKFTNYESVKKYI